MMCLKCMKIEHDIRMEIKKKKADKIHKGWQQQRKFWIGQWNDIKNKGKISLEISIENKIMEIDDMFGEAIKELYEDD